MIGEWELRSSRGVISGVSRISVWAQQRVGREREARLESQLTSRTSFRTTLTAKSELTVPGSMYRFFGCHHDPAHCVSICDCNSRLVHMSVTLALTRLDEMMEVLARLSEGLENQTHWLSCAILFYLRMYRTFGLGVSSFISVFVSVHHFIRVAVSDDCDGLSVGLKLKVSPRMRRLPTVALVLPFATHVQLAGCHDALARGFICALSMTGPDTLDMTLSVFELHAELARGRAQVRLPRA
jgi:hypothetical protein